MAPKELSRKSKFVILVLVGAMVGAGCAETSRLNTSPEGGKIYVNGIYVGEGPTVYKYRAGLPESYIVEVRKDGYKTVANATIDRSLRADISLLLLICVIVPYFFSARLEDQYVFELEPLPGTVPPAAAPAPGAPAPAPVAPPGPSTSDTGK